MNKISQVIIKFEDGSMKGYNRNAFIQMLKGEQK